MTDIVERLREGVWGRARRADAVIQANMQEAADEIERMRADYERLGQSVLAWIDCFGDLKAEYTRLEGALKRIAKGVANGPRCHAIARAALDVALNGRNDV